MNVKTYRARSLPEALRLVRLELGPDASVLGTREIWDRGLVGFLTGTRGVEVTASASLVVPSRRPQRSALLDQGIDLSGPAPVVLARWQVKKAA